VKVGGYVQDGTYLLNVDGIGSGLISLDEEVTPAKKSKGPWWWWIIVVTLVVIGLVVIWYIWYMNRKKIRIERSELDFSLSLDLNQGQKSFSDRDEGISTESKPLKTGYKNLDSDILLGPKIHDTKKPWDQNIAQNFGNGFESVAHSNPMNLYRNLYLNENKWDDFDMN
jgi:hypothetical protein